MTPSPPPDTKDWTWVLDRPCPECGFDPATIGRDDLAAIAAQDAGFWTTVLQRPDVERRPRPDTWSPLEYGCHVRDVHRITLGRLRSMLEHDDPLFDNWDQDATAIEDGYDRADPAVVVDELADAARAVAATLAEVRAEQWDRPGRRSNGSVFTVATLGVYVAHDLLHHRWDVAGTAAGSGRDRP